MSDALAAPTIITPHALPMFRDGEIARGSKRKREKDRMDPRKSKRPELPVTGPGKGGRVGASATQHVVQNLVRDTTRDEAVSGTSFLVSAPANLHLRSPTFLIGFYLLASSTGDDGGLEACPGRGACPAGWFEEGMGCWDIRQADLGESRLPPRHADIMRWLPQRFPRLFTPRPQSLLTISWNRRS